MQRFHEEYDRYRAFLIGQQHVTKMSSQAMAEHLRRWEKNWMCLSGGAASGSQRTYSRSPSRLQRRGSVWLLIRSQSRPCFNVDDRRFDQSYKLQINRHEAPVRISYSSLVTPSVQMEREPS